MKKSKENVRFETVAPDPSQLLLSMRDVGYSLETALADIIDNSISARATTIEILAETHEDPPVIGIWDDGAGMTESELVEAMRPGTGGPMTPRSSTDLGRFGLGLKTASFSQCRRLTVVSAKDGILAAATWDLDVVTERKAWVIERPASPMSVRWADKLGNNGTLVLWEKLDRLPSTAQGGGSEDVVEVLDGAINHLGLVFHRFLSGERGLRKIRILMNGRPVKAFDPFLRSHDATQPMPKEVIKYAGRALEVQGYTIPHPAKLAKKKVEEAAGTEGILKNQGFYVYRAGRLIRYGTWFGLARHRDTTKLARIQIDIPNDLDAEWKIDVRKSSASPPPVVRKALRKLIQSMGQPSRRAVTQRGTRKVSVENHPFWNLIHERDQNRLEVNTSHPLISSFEESIPDTLRGGFRNLLKALAASVPVQQIHSMIADDPEVDFAPPGLAETLETCARAYRARWGLETVTLGAVTDTLLSMAPFSLYPDLAVAAIAKVYKDLQ